MKKSILIVLFVVTAVSLAFPRAGHSWGHGHGYGWYAPGAFVGGALFGAALARPYYAYPPPPVYAYPPTRICVSGACTRLRVSASAGAIRLPRHTGA
jgi:hypothetical protein